MLALLCQHVRGLQVWGERCGLAAGVRQAQPCCCTCAGRCGMAIGLATGRQALHSGVCRTWLSNKPTQRHTARLPPVGDSRSEACRCAGARRPESGTHLRHNLTRHGDRACHLKSDHVPATSRLCSCDTPCSSTEGWPTAACLLCRDSPAQAIWEAYDQLRRMHLHDAPPQLGPSAKRLQVSQAGYRSEDGGLTPWC